MPDYTDNELVELFRTSEKKHYAFNLLVRKYREKIYYFFRRMLALYTIHARIYW